MPHLFLFLALAALGLGWPVFVPERAAAEEASDGAAAMREAAALLKAKRPKEAAAKLAPLSSARAANPELELTYGRALLDSGDPAAAAAAFRRVLALAPNHILARAYLGRALVALGEFQAARRELVILRDRGDLPPEIKTVMVRNIAMIDKSLQGRPLAAGEVRNAFPPASEADMTTIRAAADLVRGKRAAEALAMLEPLAAQLAGNPDFDYVYGVAAIDAGQPALGAKALRRALAARPDMHVARAELGRALAGVGDLAGARREFDAVGDTKDLPESARAAMWQQVRSIDQIVAAKTTTRINGFIEAAFGYDNNVNNGPSTETILIPGLAFLGPATLSPAAMPKAAGFGSVSGGLNIVHPLRDDMALFINVVGTESVPFKFKEFRTTLGGGEVGIARQIADLGLFSVAAVGQTYSIGSDVYRNIYGLAGQWRRKLAETWDATLAVSWLAMQYPHISQQDADRFTVSAALSHKYEVMFTPVVSVAVSGGLEKTRDSMIDYLSFQFLNARLLVEANIAPWLVAFVQGTYEGRRYDADYPLFFYHRADNVAEFYGGFDIKVAEDLFVRPSVRWTQIWSNVGLYDTRRTVTQVAARKQF